MNFYTFFRQTERQRVSDGAIAPILESAGSAPLQLVIVLPPKAESGEDL